MPKLRKLISRDLNDFEIRVSVEIIRASSRLADEVAFIASEWAAVSAPSVLVSVVDKTGRAAIGSMAILIGAFHLTCALFIVIVFGGSLKIVTGLNIFLL